MSSPIFSAAFWFAGRGRCVEASEPWATVCKHGGELVERQLLEGDVAYEALAEDYGLDERVLDVVREITAKRLTAGTRKVKLNRKLSNFVRDLACDRHGDERIRDARRDTISLTS